VRKFPRELRDIRIPSGMNMPLKIRVSSNFKNGNAQ
jgi:hypothetical protein